MVNVYDTAPVHPRPLPFESLTSYVTRVAQANGIQSVDAVSQLFFPSQNRRITRTLSEYTTLNLGGLALATTSTEEALLVTTFYHMGKKFGRSTHSQALSRFLSGCVSRHLRYCPLCIAEEGYYSLLWRFTRVVGCSRHQCPLLDRCDSCGSPMHFFKSPLRIGICPVCKHQLGQSHSSTLTGMERLKLERDYEIFEFLLSPQEWENEQALKLRLGGVFASKRIHKGLTGEHLAQILGVSLSSVEGLERGNLQNRGATFQVYLKYADYFHLSLRDLFAEALSI